MLKRINDRIKKIILEIYKDIFEKFREQYIIVFLCGGASDKSQKHIRDSIRQLLEKEKRRSYYSHNYFQMPIKIFYPEDLLIEVLNKTRDADLLSYEQLLADNSHLIAIICESAGSLVELGAFTNNTYTVDKVIAAIDRKRVKDKSFIMLGPVKYLKKKNKLNVLEYGLDNNKFAQKLAQNIREKYKERKENSKINLTTIIGQYYFIQLLLYFFKELDSKKMADMIQYVLDEYKIVLTDFNVIFSAALKLLFQEEYIIKRTTEKYSIYKLTQKGHQSIEGMINSCTIEGICDKIRIGIMYYDLYNSPHS